MGKFLIYNVIKDPHWYAVQVSDTTVMTIATFDRTIKIFDTLMEKFNL